MNKPKYLYHGSANQNIVVFEPRQESIRDVKEGAVVFATDSQISASKFIVPCDESWSQLSRFGDTQVAIYSDRNKFKELDKGGAIYTLSSTSFIIDPQFTKSSQEYTSRIPVKPIAKEIFNSGLKAMLKHGVKVYFVTPEQLITIKNAADHGLKIIKTLQPERY